MAAFGLVRSRRRHVALTSGNRCRVDFALDSEQMNALFSWQRQPTDHDLKELEERLIDGTREKQQSRNRA